jgi:hypothetical protein
VDIDHNEIARIKRLQKQMREREERKFRNPDAEPELEWIWVAHVWVPNNPKDVSKGEWVFAGFRRHRNRRKPQSMNGFFAKVRRKFGIDKKSPVVMRDLQSVVRLVRGKDQSWRTRPPQFQERRVTPVQPKVVLGGKATKRRAPKKAYLMDRRTTKFIALGRNSWDRDPKYMYCGPLTADYRSDAVREAERIFKMYNDIIVVKVADLSKPLRNRMHSAKRIKAGVTRLQWPEPIPEFDPLWSKLVKHKKAEPIDSDQYYNVKKIWLDADCPWLSLGWMRKQIKTLTPSTGDQPCEPTKRKAKGKGKVAVTKRQPLRSARKRRPAAMRAPLPLLRSIRTRR